MTANDIGDEKCQACRHRPVVEVIADDDPTGPYKVCEDCAHRLQNRALRPIEWFNLAAIHGWSKYLLHDDFYDQDGTAVQPSIELLPTEGFRAPTLKEASASLDRLVDYCITRWWLDEVEHETLRAVGKESLMEELQFRVKSGNTEILQVAYDICGNVLGEYAGPWVRTQYARACEDHILLSWARAAAETLPRSEGLQKTISALGRLDDRERRARMIALSWFRSPAGPGLDRRKCSCRKCH